MNISTNESSELYQCIHKAIEHENVKDFAIVNSEKLEKGGGYISEVVFVKIKATKVDGSKVEYDLVVKITSPGNNGDQFPFKLLFDRETYVYTRVVPEFKKFEVEKGLEPFDMVKCYNAFSVKNREVLVLENLKTLGYSMHDARVPLNPNHISLVLKSYAHWHALSLVLRDQNPTKFSKLFENLEDMYVQVLSKSKNVDDWMLGSQKIVMEVLKDTNQWELLKLLEIKLQKGHKTEYSEHAEFAKRDKYVVFIHGDCWNNNFMFKYEELDKDKENPTKVALLDFQVSSLSSPVIDLSYFLYSVTSSNDVKNINNYLDQYYAFLSQKIHQLGSDPDKIFPHSVLLEQWKKYAILGFCSFATVCPLTIINRENSVKNVEEFGGDSARLMLDSFKTEEKEKFSGKIVNVVRHLLENEM